MSYVRVSRRVCFFGLCLLIAFAAQAAVVVTNNSGGTGAPGCKLRDAIRTADTLTPHGGCLVPPSDPRVVLLQAGEIYTLFEPDDFSTTNGISGLPLVQNEVRIEGNGATIERDADPATPPFRLFSTEGTLRLVNLTLRSGVADYGILPLDIDFSPLSIGDVFPADSISPSLPFNDEGAGYRMFSSATFGSFDAFAGSPEIFVASGVAAGLPKALCPRPSNTEAACTGALNLTFASDAPASNISFAVGNDFRAGTFDVEVILSLNASRTNLVFGSFTMDGNPATPRTISVAGIGFENAAGNPVDINATTPVYAMAVDSAASETGLLYDQFGFLIQKNSFPDCSTPLAAEGSGGAVRVAPDTGGTDAAELFLTNVTLEDNHAVCSGGAVAASNARLQIENSVFRNNSVEQNLELIGACFLEEPVAPTSGRGGALYSLLATDGAIIDGTLFENNVATTGGGVYSFNFSGSDLILESVFRNNRAEGARSMPDSSCPGGNVVRPAGRGGGLFYGLRRSFSPEIPAIADTTFVGNSALEMGGGIYIDARSGPLGSAEVFHIARVTVADNQAAQGGGIVLFDQELSSPADLHEPVVISNSTVSGNRALGGEFPANAVEFPADQVPDDAPTGGGILNISGNLSLFFSTLLDNEAIRGLGIASNDRGLSTLGANIIAHNDSVGEDCWLATYDSAGCNFDSDGTCKLLPIDATLPVPPGAVAPVLDALFGPLQDNGGSTDTHALLTGGPEYAGNPVIDVLPPPAGGLLADYCNASATDQRGITRPDGGNCDSGAYETTGDVFMPPISDPGGPYSGIEDDPIAFDGSDSMDPDGVIVNYAWTFGDGATASGVAPSHTYASSGAYTVTLTVTDKRGSTDTASTTATIADSNVPPTADAGGPYSGTAGIPIVFDGSASDDPDGTIVSYSWDFGDGSTGTGVSPSHTYVSAGSFTATLTVTDDDGAMDTAEAVGGGVTVVEGNQPPVADAGGPYSGTAGVPVVFDGSASTDLDGTIVSYSWDFGDGATGTGVSPSHTYGAAGSYVVSLTVTDDDGAMDTAEAVGGGVNVVEGNQPPIADAGGPYSGTAGFPVTFDGSASSDSDGSIVSYSWDFGDGSTGTGVAPSHTYSAAGTFVVTLTVTDDDGATDSAIAGGGGAQIDPPVVNNPPNCSAAEPSQLIIWPPNHKFVRIDVLNIVDPDGDSVFVLVNSIFQDEPVNGIGDGNTARDGRGVGTPTAEVRAERSGTKKTPGDGRVYHISFSASDESGATCSGTVQVGVPKSKKKTPVDGGPIYDSTVP